MKRLVLQLVSVAVAVFCRGGFAAPVDATLAKRAAQAWIDLGYSMDRLAGRTVDSVETLSADSATLHLAKLQGGGFVVLSADDTIDPVILFSGSGSTIDTNDANPLWALVKADLASRAAASDGVSGTPVVRGASAGGLSTSALSSSAQGRWAELLGTAKTVRAVSSIPEVRVEPFLETKWNQRSVGEKPVYNYYTPSNYYCGCVATATGQIMRHYKWPTASVSTNKYACSVDGTAKNFRMKGGCYDWDNMPAIPTSAITPTEQRAIGRLTYDIGCSVGMAWAANGSGASIFSARLRLKDTFKYASCEGIYFTDKYSSGNYNYSLARCKKIVIPCLEYGSLVEMSITGSGGHAVVVDGYGYSGSDFYMHINCGWGGSSDAWYCPPDLTMGPYAFTGIDGFIFNILPQGTGTIISGRVLDAAGAPIANASVVLKASTTVRATAVTNAKGIYALLAPKTGGHTLTATYGGHSAEIAVTVNANNSKQMADSGGYYYQSGYAPTLGNMYDKNIQITEIESAPVPVISPAGCTFYPSTNVTLTCALPGATIRYTTDGSDPCETSALYTGPIAIADDTTLRARSFKEGMNASAITYEIYTYDVVKGGPKGDFYEKPIAIYGASGTYVIADNTDYTLEPGEAAHTYGTEKWSYEYRTSWYKWTAPGSGTMTFMTRCANQNTLLPTAVAVYADGVSVPTVRQSWLAACSDIDSSGGYTTSVSLPVVQGTTYRIVGVPTYNLGGAFTLSWFGDLTTVVRTETETTEVPVPYAWLEGYYGRQSEMDYETLGNSDGANGCRVWQSYLLGLDPTNANSRLEAVIRFENGIPVVGWNVTNAHAEAHGYTYRVKGRASLADGDWTFPTDATHRFFKVVLEK